MLSAVLNIKKYCQKFYRWLFPSSDQLCSILSEGKYFFCNELETIEHFFINCKNLDDFWLRVTFNTFKSCGMSKLVRSLQYLVIGYKTELVEYKWINVLFNYIGFTLYKPYICSDRRTKLCNWSKLTDRRTKLCNISKLTDRRTKLCNISKLLTDELNCVIYLN